MRLSSILAILSLTIPGPLLMAPSASGASNISYGITVGTSLPANTASVRVGRNTYRVYHGSFYRQMKHGFVLVPAPLGASIKSLPRGAEKMKIGKATYYRHAGVYFHARGRNYVVSKPPAETATTSDTAEAAAPREVAVQHGDENYVFRRGRFFLQSPDGLLGRSTPVGAITNEFPPDALSVWFNDREYFESGGVFFQEIAGGTFKVVPPPWQSVAPTTDPQAVAQVSTN
jgi:hypothetical protein